MDQNDNGLVNLRCVSLKTSTFFFSFFLWVNISEKSNGHSLKGQCKKAMAVKFQVWEDNFLQKFSLMFPSSSFKFKKTKAALESISLSIK